MDFTIRHVYEIISKDYEQPISIDEKSKVWVDEIEIDGEHWYFVKIVGIDGYVYMVMNTKEKSRANAAVMKIKNAVRSGQIREYASSRKELDTECVNDYDDAEEFGNECYD